MEHIAALLLLIGCNDSASQCDELPSPTVGYETIEQCEEAVAPALRLEGRGYPLVIAKCLPVDPLAEGDMEIVWDIDANGELQAEVNPLDDEAIETEPVIAELTSAEKESRLR